MKLLVLPFVVLLAVPVGQVGADAWRGRSGPTLHLPHRYPTNGADTFFTKWHDERYLTTKVRTIRGAQRSADPRLDSVAGLVGIEGGVVSGVINLESSGVEASDWRPRHDEHYHQA
jgi:hypothetical protein